ncbi:MAG: S9 family peptidase [Chloroflexia bacterium]|nr:S9 family peptidase [Chloroflexia bacterium]
MTAENAMRWTMDEIVRFRCPTGPSWSPDGAHLAFFLSGAGREQLCLLDRAGRLRELPPLPASPAAKMWGGVQPAYDWFPDGRALLRVAGGLWRCDLDGGPPQRLTPGQEPESHPSCSPDGRTLAFRQGARVALLDLATGGLDGFDLPGPLYAFAPHLAWSLDGALLAAAFRRLDAAGRPARRGLDLAVVTTQGRLLWATDTPGTAANPQWLDARRLLFSRYNRTHTRVEHVLLHLPAGPERLLLAEEEPRGLPADFVEGLGSRGPLLSPDGRAAVLVRPHQGWDRLHLLDLQSGHLHLLTEGPGEEGEPAWSPEGRRLAYLANGRPTPFDRELRLLDLRTGQVRALCSGPGVRAEPVWSPDGRALCFVRAGPGEPPALWRLEVDSGEAACLAPAWPAGSMWRQDVPPEAVWIEAADGRPAPALFYARPGLRGRPGLIWLHGGPGMQHYRGWPADYGYAMHHAVHQLLLERGYSLLYLDYRGSTGYGAAHEQANYLGIGTAELADLEGAARFLAGRPEVGAAPLVLMGRSYGGYVALSGLARLPHLFQLGIIVAGFGDMHSYFSGPPDFWDDAACFRWRMGWSAEEQPRAWAAADVLPDLGRLRAPLALFHGRDDQAVPVEDARDIEQRCRALGKTCFYHEYAGEDHVFAAEATWRDFAGHLLGYLARFAG